MLLHGDVVEVTRVPHELVDLHVSCVVVVVAALKSCATWV
jgi:hypothetical protein